MSYRLGPQRRRDRDVEYIDTLDVLLIPISFEQTCDTMWQSMIRLYRQREWHHYDSVHMIVHFVMRRYVEKERMVVVWRALSEGEGEFTGIHSDETGWCIVRPNNSEEPLLRVVMQTFVRFIPMDFVVTSVEEDGAEIARMMDSLLLEDNE
ncbi:uncharacterized protein PITG_09115 [Phytophthora infestans T30-4]|uniref:M96 mating-specific protein family n=1 Tax=Phytophthora infestans (strain T30-4) TaxID=403677 RepID=D0NBQ9_PHYIT|nr:uncharacterized protein PITG_09115 [Phytophthora infestans T30-4]EEY55214.1 conserved hypothetical protein [Phytophthora infestans T30-4]|eukprot:XP_002903438.1 conserved hypothetical protein [Phytophthora infestans T30-4]